MLRRVMTICAVTLALGATRTHAQIGVLGGYNRDTFHGFSDERFELVDDKVDGFHTGIFLDFSFGLFGVRPSVVYHRLTKAVLGEGESPPSDIEIIEFPVEGRVTATFSTVRPYVIAGPTVMFPSSPAVEVDEALAGARVRWNVGLGVEWDVGFRVWPEVRIGSTIGGLVEDDETDGSRLTTFMARIGLSF